METLATWCSLAQEFGEGKLVLANELKDAETTVHSLGQAIQSTRQRILALMQSDNADAHEICTQERQMLLLGQQLFRKRAAVVRVAVAHCLEAVKELNAKMRSVEATLPWKSHDMLQKLQALIDEELEVPQFHESELRSLAKEIETCWKLVERSQEEQESSPVS